MMAQTSVTLGTVSAGQGQIVSVPVTLSGCDATTGGTGITGIEMHFSYTSALQYYGISGLYSGFSAGDWTYNGTGSQFIALWSTPTFLPYDIPNGTVLFNVQFIARNGGTSPLNFLATGSQSILLDSNFDIIAGTTWNNGSATVPAAAATSTWSSSTAQSWTTAANWSNGLPGLNTNVIVATGVVTIDNAAFLCNNLTVNPGAGMTINSGITVSVPGSLTLESSASNLPTGSLINNGTLNVTGQRKVKRFLTGGMNHFISTPLRLGTTVSTIYNPYNPGWAYNWNESSASWSSMIQLTTPLIIGSGYVVNYTLPQTLTFSITDNPGFNMGGTYNPNTSYTSGNGWNLVGNPFTAPLNWLATGYTKSKIDNAIYFYNGTTYASFVNGVGTNGGTQYIPAMQGFFIHANATGPNFVMPRSACVHHAQTYYKDAPADLLRISILGNDASDETVIRFSNASTEGFDTDYDAYKLMSMDESVPQVYSSIPDADFSINSLPEINSTVIVPVSYRAATDGMYSLNFENIVSFAKDVEIYLEDLNTGAVTDLRSSKSYSFETTAGTSDRFRIRFEKSTGIGDRNQQGASVFSLNKNIYVNNVHGMIQVYTMAGQQVTNLNSDGSLTTVGMNHAPEGIYLVKTVNGNTTKVTKVLVK
jgi:hypothetical protein